MITSLDNPDIDRWLKVIENNPNKKHWMVRRAIHIVNQEISSLRFNALKRIGGQYASYLMGHEANFLDKQLREALS